MRIRNSKGRFVATRDVIDRADTLKKAGFGLYHVWPEDTRNGYVSSYRMDGDYLGGHRIRTVTGESSSVYGDCFVSLEDVARGEDSYGQSDTVVRSNFIAIRRDHPQYPWVLVSYGNVDGLGIFVKDLDEDMVNLFVGLREQYPVYDEEEMSRLEQEEIEESWDGYMRSEIRHELSEPARTMWDVIGEDMVTELWWACVSLDVFGCYPEHRGVEVVWGDRDKRVADFRPYLIRAYATIRKGLSVTDGYEFVRLTRRLMEMEAGK